MKTVKLEKMEGKNQWNLTMYAGTAVELPVNTASSVYDVTVTSKSQYIDCSYEGEDGVWIEAEDLGQKKTVSNKVVTCKAYNKSDKCLSTLKIVVEVLPANTRLKRKEPATAKELYQLGYSRGGYSDYEWNELVSEHPEVLLTSASHSSKIYEPQMRDGEELSLTHLILDSLHLEECDTDLEKLMKLFSWSEEHIEYDWNFYLAYLGVSKHADSKEDSTKRQYVCQDYARFARSLCGYAGIDCFCVISESLHHMWNFVKLDGYWYAMDWTWHIPYELVNADERKREINLANIKDAQEEFGGEIAGEEQLQVLANKQEVMTTLEELNELKDWEYLPQKYKELIESEVTLQAFKSYKSFDELPESLKDLTELYDFFFGVNGQTMLERYYKWLDKGYNPAEDKEMTFLYWFVKTEVLCSYQDRDEYTEWFQNKYDPEIHVGFPPAYWKLNVKGEDDGLFYSLHLLQTFSDVFEVVK